MRWFARTFLYPFRELCCTHEWELLHHNTYVVKDDIGVLKSGPHWIYRCKRCGLFQERKP